VRKVACGAAEVLPFIPVTNLARTLKSLQEKGIWLFGAAGEADQSVYDSNLTGPIGILMGAEGDGLRRLTQDTCDHLINIPMAGTVSSLNVSVATGVCLFEAVRQRRVPNK
jgi:23S rRNA (guanosine2251-2'-O)-methyltransferase